VVRETQYFSEAFEPGPSFGLNGWGTNGMRTYGVSRTISHHYPVAGRIHIQGTSEMTTLSIGSTGSYGCVPPDPLTASSPVSSKQVPADTTATSRQNQLLCGPCWSQAAKPP